MSPAPAPAGRDPADWKTLAVAIVSHFEGCAHKGSDGLIHPYLDHLAKPPVWTRGFGRTYGITESSPAISIDDCKAELADGLVNYAKSCLAAAPNLARRPACLAAVVSWAWNCGTGAFRHSRLRRAIVEERWKDAAEYIRKPRTAGGIELAGLCKRRDAEASLFRSGLRDVLT